MKKLLSILLVFVFLFSFVACKRDKNNDLPTSGQVSGEGVSDEIVDDESVEYETDKKGEYLTDAVGSPLVKNTDPSKSDSFDQEQLTQPPTLISDETLPTGEKVEVTTKPDGQPEKSLLETALGNSFKGKKYSFKFTALMEAEGVTQRVPAAIYVSGKKSLVEMTIGGVTEVGLVKMGILNNDKGKYVLLSFMGLLKGYMEMPDEASGDYDAMFDFTDFSDTADMEYQGTGKVKYKGVDYIYEEYRGEDFTIKFFFADGKLKRIEQVNDDGTKVIMENIEISSSFNESVFNIPPGYKELKEEDLKAFLPDSRVKGFDP
ncbi:MAG: hypothetical protein GX345_06460 [Clostridiales bacterium]|nr:hypothetical protein [Clostridiales bacterium]